MSTRKPRRGRKPIPRKPAVPPKASKPARPPAKPVRPAAKPVRPAAAKPASGADTGTAVKLPPAKPAAPKDPYIGRTIGRCLIEERIGLGKTAAVYRAHYEALDEKVAVKILTPQASKMPELVERFHSEAKVVASLDNENVVKVYDVGRSGDAHFMVMELLDGFSVLDLIQREDQIEVMDALRIVRQVANGLAAAHAKGIIHRDVKPQNLLLLEDGTVKVLDFGLAAGFDDKNERVGTPHYMAPEVCRDGTADLGTDIYGLGIVLWHLLTGQPPYAGKDIQTILRAHMSGTPLRPERVRHDTPKNVAELVRSMTKQDPLLRPPASELVELLDNIGGEEVKEHGHLRSRRSRGSRARVAASKKSPLGPALVGLVLVAGIGIAIAAGSGGDDDTVPAKPTDVGTAGTGDPAPLVKRIDEGIGAPPTQSEAARLAEEKFKREQKEAAEQREKEAAGKKALARAEQYAREYWNSKTDTQAVIDKYQRVYSKHRKTEAGKEALRRLKGIKAATIHPHPDREWSDEQSIAEVRQTWRDAQPEIEALLKDHNYAGATAKLPPQVNEADGALTKELRFWRTLIGQLKLFKSSLISGISKLSDDDRIIDTPDGTGTVRLVKLTQIEVLVKGGMRTYKWSELAGDQLFELGRRLAPEKGTTQYVHCQSFAFAHRLEKAFWDVQLDIMSASDASKHSAWLADIERRFTERMKQK